jgi:hypothetical protein
MRASFRAGFDVPREITTSSSSRVFQCRESADAIFERDSLSVFCGELRFEGGLLEAMEWRSSRRRLEDALT